jgi:hypothetical protein
MRLGDVLSKPKSLDYIQIDGFLSNKKGLAGQQVKITIGEVLLNYYCNQCNDMRTFAVKGDLHCIFVNHYLVSIDSVLACACGTDIQVWFLVESKGDIRGFAPNVRILKKCVRLSDSVKIESHYGEYSVLLNKADMAYQEGFGAGSVVYLRKLYEKITIDTARNLGIVYPAHENGNPRNFHDLLENIGEKFDLIPKEFSRNGYRLFRDLSNFVHGDLNEEMSLAKFRPLRTLICGILDNIFNSNKLREAIGTLGWFNDDE